MSETVTTTLQLCRDLKAAIDARMLGRQIQSAGERGRNVSYADLPVKDLISYYRQMRSQCAEAQAELPDIQPLDAPISERRPPIGHLGRPWV